MAGRGAAARPVTAAPTGTARVTPPGPPRTGTLPAWILIVKRRPAREKTDWNWSWRARGMSLRRPWEP
eukprot:349961-Chlamydomonas_euryale.AAC.6